MKELGPLLSNELVWYFRWESHGSVPLFWRTSHGLAQGELMYERHDADDFRHNLHAFERIFWHTFHASCKCHNLCQGANRRRQVPLQLSQNRIGRSDLAPSRWRHHVTWIISIRLMADPRVFCATISIQKQNGWCTRRHIFCSKTQWFVPLFCTESEGSVRHRICDGQRVRTLIYVQKQQKPMRARRTSCWQPFLSKSRMVPARPCVSTPLSD